MSLLRGLKWCPLCQRHHKLVHLVDKPGVVACEGCLQREGEERETVREYFDRLNVSSATAERKGLRHTDEISDGTQSERREG